MANESNADEPTLADDEAALARYVASLVDAVESVVSDWMKHLVDRRIPGAADRGEPAALLDEGAANTVRELRALLELDIADQRVGPLEILRRAVRYPTAVLEDAGAAPAERDEFARRNFPDDRYDLTPASFAEIDPSLHEPGLIWGAAKAHVHLRRRRE